jgi:hypothetical protein
MHLGSIAVTGRLVDLAADLRVTVMIMPSKKKSSPWQPAYKQKLGLWMTNCDIKTSVVIEAVYSFCKYFRRQVDMVNRKRIAHVANQTYGSDFRADVMTKHMESQHHEKWSEYQALSPSEQLKFFNGIVSHNNMLHRYIEIDDDELTFKISNVVVDTIIGKLLFRPEDEMAALKHDDGEAFDSNIAKRVARLFKLKRNTLQLFKPDGKVDDGSYVVMIKNVKRFQLIIKHVSCGVSFRQIAAAIGHTRDVMGIEKLSGMSDHLVGQCVRVVVSVALTKIGVLLSNDDVWAFSIAFDGSTHCSTAFFDVRIRISVKGILYNFHLIAMPHFGCHTVDLQVKMLVTLFGALCVSWANKLINVATDGERTNMGHITNIQKQLVDLATHDVTQVNCVNHQADLVIQATVELIDGGNFVTKVYEAMVYLRKQNTLITEMGVASPKKTNRWAALNSVLQFDIKYERQIIAFLDERCEQRSVAVPPILSEAWWVHVFTVVPGLELIHKMFCELQARLLLICQQRTYVNKLAVTSCTTSIWMPSSETSMRRTTSSNSIGS